uniref:UPAR/Ly6 domain-containing protein n=1 Tax=Terrapene triunguis TaxID=2587831 RepID=A0A674J103_9SAUR
AALRCYSCDGDGSCQEIEDCGEQQGWCRTTVLTMIAREWDRPRAPFPASLSQPVPRPGAGSEPEPLRGDRPRAPFPAPLSQPVPRPGAGSEPEPPRGDRPLPHSLRSPLEGRGPTSPLLSLSPEFPQDERRIKGCGQISQCQEPLGFHNQDSFYLLQCCNSTLCNNDAHGNPVGLGWQGESPLPLNGVTCYACEGNSGHGCAPEHVTAVQCQGPMTHCMEAVGSHGEEPQNQQGVPCCGGGAGATIPWGGGGRAGGGAGSQDSWVLSPARGGGGLVVRVGGGWESNESVPTSLLP